MSLDYQYLNLYNQTTKKQLQTVVNKTKGRLPMAYTQEKHDPKLEALIQDAVKKIDGKKENDICRFLPVGTGGYIHHFTMQKMKTEDPHQLQTLINKFIINVNRPTEVPPKPRAARGSRKRRDQLLFSKQDIELLLTIARQTGNKDLVKKLTPKKDLKTVKRELIASIRHGRTDQDLWHSYVEAATTQNSFAPNSFAEV